MSVHYRGQEFARIGYYVLNSYRGEAEDASTLPLEEVLAHTERVIIHEKPRVTKFDISWQEIKAEEMEQPEGSCLPKEAR
jgi:histone chaperone ASF1